MLSAQITFKWRFFASPYLGNELKTRISSPVLISTRSMRAVATKGSVSYRCTST